MTNKRISTSHRAEVQVPEAVYIAFGFDNDYKSLSVHASSFVEVSGQDAGGSVYEWGESSEIEPCEKFLAVWDKAIENWQKRLL